MEREMRTASDAMEYERAARIRDDIGALQRAMEQNAVVFRDGTDADVIALAEDPLEVAVQIFHVRGGRIRGQRGWVADRFDDSGSEALVEQFLLQLYGDADPTTTDRDAVPREILVPVLPSSLESLTGMLSERRGAHVDIRVPQRGDKRALMETVARNASETLVKHKTSRAGDLSTRNRALEEIQEALELRGAAADRVLRHLQPPGHRGGGLDGRLRGRACPRKGEYRRFVIRGVDGQNDVASMHEVITRRFRRLLDDRGRDGAAQAHGWRRGPAAGRPHHGGAPPVRVRAVPGRRRRRTAPGGRRRPGARRARHLRHRPLRPRQAPRGGLAARSGGAGDPARTSEGLYLLQRLRDEAHRFAITHHRTRRSKSMVESCWTRCRGSARSGARPDTHFGSLKKLRQASVEESPWCRASARSWRRRSRRRWPRPPQARSHQHRDRRGISGRAVGAPDARAGPPGRLPAAVGGSDGRAGTAPADENRDTRSVTSGPPTCPRPTRPSSLPSGWSWSRHVGCQAAPPRPTTWRTSAGTSSTTCRRTSCPRSAARPARAGSPGWPWC
jgi:excinuclease ABC subunit C